MALDIAQKKNILECVANFSEVAKKEKWISHYDTDTDSMSIRAPKLSRNAEKRYVNDEFAFYLNAANKVEGVFIEYFVANFISHSKELKDIREEIKKEIKANRPEESAVIQLENKETRKIIPEIEGALVDSLLHTA